MRLTWGKINPAFGIEAFNAYRTNGEGQFAGKLFLHHAATSAAQQIRVLHRGGPPHYECWTVARGNDGRELFNRAGGFSRLGGLEWSVASGALPPGLALGTDGRISGTLNPLATGPSR